MGMLFPTIFGLALGQVGHEHKEVGCGAGEGHSPVLPPEHPT